MHATVHTKLYRACRHLQQQQCMPTTAVPPTCSPFRLLNGQCIALNQFGANCIIPCQAWHNSSSDHRFRFNQATCDHFQSSRAQLIGTDFGELHDLCAGVIQQETHPAVLPWVWGHLNDSAGVCLLSCAAGRHLLCGMHLVWTEKHTCVEPRLAPCGLCTCATSLFTLTCHLHEGMIQNVDFVMLGLLVFVLTPAVHDCTLQIIFVITLFTVFEKVVKAIEVRACTGQTELLHTHTDNNTVRCNVQQHGVMCGSAWLRVVVCGRGQGQAGHACAGCQLLHPTVLQA